MLKLKTISLQKSFNIRDYSVFCRFIDPQERIHVYSGKRINALTPLVFLSEYNVAWTNKPLVHPDITVNLLDQERQLYKTIPKKRFNPFSPYSYKKAWLLNKCKCALDNGFNVPLYIKHINNEIGFGLFARDQAIPPLTPFIEYTGIIIPSNQNPESAYLHNRTPFRDIPAESVKTLFRTDVDAEPAGNYARYANHSYRPNASRILFFHEKSGMWRIVCISNRRINQNSQILFNYGSRYWEKRDVPVVL
ncbi:MAG: SET domain-containing protein-lysine N-methyltransferase [Candidatus Margulisbacteria bacterium]|nr:SET domain-containing protein-lysine N-methyltransferase [Candidatus Margulisiibacteriota bacterium]